MARRASGGSAGGAPARPGAGAPFRVLDHTADLGIEVEAPSAEEALARLVLAMGSLLAGGGPAGNADDGAVEADPLAPGPAEVIACEGGPDLRGSALSALRELLYRFATRRQIPAACRVLRLDERGAELEVSFAPWDPEAHGEGADLKAVTWHASALERLGDGWAARVIFDV